MPWDTTWGRGKRNFSKISSGNSQAGSGVGRLEGKGENGVKGLERLERPERLERLEGL